MVGFPVAVETAVGVVVMIGIVGGAYHKYVVEPARQEAADAMATARNAKDRAQDAEETAEAVADRLDDRLDDIDDSLEGIEQSLAEQAREARGRSFRMYRLTEAIRESDSIETDKIPEVDEDDILRGGGGRPRHEEDD